MEKKTTTRYFENTDLDVLVDGKYRVPPLIEALLAYLEQPTVIDTPGLLQQQDCEYFVPTLTSSDKKQLLSNSIYRKRVEDIKQIKKRLQKHEEIGHELELIKDPHVVSGLLKLFLLQLKEPLLTSRLSQKFATTECTTTTTTTYRSLIHVALSPPRQALLKRLILFFRNVLEHQDNNLQSLEIICKTFSKFFQTTVGVLQTLITQYFDLFELTNEDAIVHLKEDNQHLKDEISRLRLDALVSQKRAAELEDSRARILFFNRYKNRVVRCFTSWKIFVLKKKRVPIDNNNMTLESTTSSSISQLQVSDFRLLSKRNTRNTSIYLTY